MTWRPRRSGLWIREAILGVASLLVELRQALTERAERADEAIAAGAEPSMLLGHVLLAYVEQFYRDGNRLKEVYVRSDILPLGAGDGAGVAVALDRGYVARLLGMHANTRNSVDGAVDRDFAIECLAALALIGARVARLLDDPACGLTPPGPDHVTSLRELAAATAGAWSASTQVLAMPQFGLDSATDAIDSAVFDAIGRTATALRIVIQAVRDTPIIADRTATPALDRFISRGGTAPSIVRAAIQDTYGRIDTYRQWIAERRVAHPSVEQLRRYPSDRQPTLLPHG